ncbi:MAG TPA: TlyA family RNA methyltransferase [Nitrospirales bacterium]|nr:TlyA family RNA methyltransferase [Nitrospirales bacterium]
MGQKAPRERLDVALVARGLAGSREQAGRMILAGAVTVNGVRVDKQAKLIASDAEIDVASRAAPYVSRAGAKLAEGLDRFSIDPTGVVAMDVGASTGGFTDCLLQRGARKVYAVDVGYGQLDWRLRQDPRVVVLERRNIRYLERADVPEPIGLAVIDVSFISLELAVPAVLPFLDRAATIITLIKPQFEVGKGKVGRGGIVRDEELRRDTVDRVVAALEALGLQRIGICDSPVPGQKGNREVVAGFRYAAKASHA